MMNKIKQRREELGLSQAELGKLIGCSQQHIQRLEMGYDTKPEKILLLAKRLNLPVEDVISENWKQVIKAIPPKETTDDTLIYNKVSTVVKVVEDFITDHKLKIDSEKKAQIIAGLTVKLLNTPPNDQAKIIEFALDWELNKQIV